LNKKEQEIKNITMQKNDAMEKLQSSKNHFEAMQNQIRDGQNKYWEELQRLKSNEIAIQVEDTYIYKPYQIIYTVV
jgi:peptidoglycan hydrolase CwlO-like protein